MLNDASLGRAQRETKRELLASIKRVKRDFQRQEAVLRNEIASLQGVLLKVPRS